MTAPKEKWLKWGKIGANWGKLGEVGKNGGNCGKFWMLDGKMGNLPAEKVKKKHGFDWQQGYGGGGCIGESSQGKIGGNGRKWGEMGENGATKPVHPSPTIFVICPPPPPITAHVPPFPPNFHLIPPHFPPFVPISPHFPPFVLVLGTLRVRCWVYYHPPRPGISEACTGAPWSCRGARVCTSPRDASSIS